MANTLPDQPQPSPAPPYDAAAFVPRFPTGLLRNVAIDIALPWTVVAILTRGWGFSDPAAVALAALFPAVSVIADWARRRHLDLIGVLVFVTLAGAVGVVLATGDIRFALLKPAPGAVLFGLGCLITLGRERPLMFFLARQVTAGDDPAKLAAWNARVGQPGFRRAMRVLTLVWGLVFLAKAMLWAAAVFLLPQSLSLVFVPTLGIGMLAALFLWTIAFARRRAGARR